MCSVLFSQTGCKSNLDEFLAARGEPGGIEQIQKEFCSNHYLEVQQQILSVNGEIVPLYQDLFMEEGSKTLLNKFSFTLYCYDIT